jgi:hypothetical protein
VAPRCAQGCGNWGITSTAAIDKQLGVVYVASPDGFLHAFQLGSGTEENSHWPTPIPARTAAEYVWGGLRIVNSRVYVGVGSYAGFPTRSRGSPTAGSSASASRTRRIT